MLSGPVVTRETSMLCETTMPIAQAPLPSARVVETPGDATPDAAKALAGLGQMDKE